MKRTLSIAALSFFGTFFVYCANSVIGQPVADAAADSGNAACCCPPAPSTGSGTCCTPPGPSFTMLLPALNLADNAQRDFEVDVTGYSEVIIYNQHWEMYGGFPSHRAEILFSGAAGQPFLFTGQKLGPGRIRVDGVAMRIAAVQSSYAYPSPYDQWQVAIAGIK